MCPHATPYDVTSPAASHRLPGASFVAIPPAARLRLTSHHAPPFTRARRLSPRHVRRRSRRSVPGLPRGAPRDPSAHDVTSGTPAPVRNALWDGL